MRLTAIERAFELARTGLYEHPEDIRKKLGAEGYNAKQIQGRALVAQLRELGKSARAQTEPQIAAMPADTVPHNLNPD